MPKRDKARIAFSLYGCLRIEMRQYNSGRWGVRMINRTSGETESLHRHINEIELQRLIMFLTQRLNKQLICADLNQLRAEIDRGRQKHKCSAHSATKQLPIS